MAAFTKSFRKVFDPTDAKPYTVSRSKVDLFVECPRCMYLDARYSIKRPEFPAFTLNNAVDELLKREFDIHRAKGSIHPLLKQYKLDFVPLRDERMEGWRDALRRGIGYLHAPSNLYVRGGVDDVWTNEKGELIVVDYKATSKKIAPAKDSDLYDGYKRQLEIYQWLFRQNGFTVHPAAYFVYVNGKSDAKAFDGKLEFDVALIAYEGSDAWIPDVLMNLKATLLSEDIPRVGDQCNYCRYRESAGKALLERHKNNGKKSKKDTVI
jgi:hypothetical protein